jgi:hypothetical protein
MGFDEFGDRADLASGPAMDSMVNVPVGQILGRRTNVSREPEGVMIWQQVRIGGNTRTGRIYDAVTALFGESKFWIG